MTEGSILKDLGEVSIIILWGPSIIESISDQTAITSLHSISRLTFITERVLTARYELNR
jgi:hypothetical protein